MRTRFGLLLAFLFIMTSSALAQTTSFTYQGKLGDNGTPATGNYDFQFSLFDALGGGSQLGTTQTLTNQLVTNGIFSVQLDFVSCPGCSCPTCFNGGARFLAIAVRPTGGGAYTPLAPRQPITSTPYAVKSMNATNATTADGLSVACVNCVTSGQIQSVNGSSVTGAIPVDSVPAGSDNYIQNTVGTQPNAYFDIGGSGHIGGALRIEGTGFFLPDTPSLSLSSSGIFQIDAPFLPSGRFVVKENGNVGIGNGAPTEKLDVAGNARISGNLSATGIISGDGSGLTNLKVINSQQIALLKWYDANQTTTFAVPIVPKVLSFDGEHMWVAAVKMRVSDGAIVNSVTDSGSGSAYDGANLWLAADLPNKVAKIRGSDSTLVARYDVGSQPGAVAFDGANIWVVNNVSNNVTKLRASDGACVGTCTFAVGTFPISIAFDGTNIWVGNGPNKTVTKLRASDGTSLGTIQTIGVPAALAFDGTNMWVVNQGSDTQNGSVMKIRAADNAVLGTFPVGHTAQGIAYDGANVWVTNFDDNTVTRLRASDGACVGSCTFPVGVHPTGIAFDGAHIWVANSGSNTVSKL